jgi:hypothetical protein
VKGLIEEFGSEDLLDGAEAERAFVEEKHFVEE